MKKTACPLDCFDSCSVVLDGEKLKGEKAHPITKGYLCPHLNNWFKHEKLTKPRLNGEEISLDNAIKVLKEKLFTCKSEKTLLYRGSGNLGRLQNVTNLFFSSHNAVIAKGSLCEEGGSYGIEEGRGKDLLLSPLEVAKSEVVVIWGRNSSVTNSHMLPALKGKTLIVIDPVKTDIAKKADLFVQCEPRSDMYLALLLARVAYMEEMEDSEFIELRTNGFDDFLDLVTGIPMKALMQKCGVNLDVIGDILHLIRDKKVSFLVGLGVQKYAHANQVLRAIDSLVAMLGLFGKEGCGVGYIADSGYGYANPFGVKTKEDSVVNADFSKYDLVFIQGSNPASQMPNSKSVRDNLEKSFVVYFGLHENETSKLANLVIPACSFLEKNDVKLSYGHEYIGYMPKLMEAKSGISEYDLTKELMKHFGYEELKSENEYIEEIISSNSIVKDGYKINKLLSTIPYEKEFYTNSGRFEFLDDIDDDFEKEEDSMYLLTAKWPSSLNSQFKVNPYLHVPTSLKLQDDEVIELKSEYGECKYKVKNDERLREDSFLVYSGNPNANMLTPSKPSDEGNSAIYQEIQVTWNRI